MKYHVITALSGAALAIAGITGCSNNQESSSTPSYEQTSETASADSSSTSNATVTIDGKPQDIQGQIVCTAAGGNYNIAIGEAATGIAVVMSEDASTVHSVGLGNVDGVTLGFQENVTGDATASATKDGNSYTITGTATGVDMANPLQPVTKPFEIAVTCP